MLLGEFIVNASVARVAVKIVLLTSDFADTALNAMPLALGCVIVIK